MSKTNRDRNWDLIGDMLAAETSGKSPRLFASRKTLFGIPSALDEELATFEACGQQANETHGFDNQADTGKAAHVQHPLQPIFDERSRVLILGTMPSPKSRETGFYYNHPQNRFWRVMAALFDDPIPATNQEKEQLVLHHGIALWDVLAECTIEGAKDGTIAECVPNDINSVIVQAPIEAIFCTGAKAAELYKRYCENSTCMEAIRLPSTSPANAATSLGQLIEAYRAILPFCVKG